MFDPRAFLPAVVSRFEDKISEGPGGCWLWLAAKDPDGYGKFQVVRRSERAHRWSYEYHIGSIPDDLVIDHLCRNRSCVNPWHLEPVTGHVNATRGERAQRRTCINGHLYTADSLYRPPATNGRRDARVCRECNREAVQRYRERRAEKKAG